MDTLYNLFIEISKNYGNSVALIIFITGGIGYAIYFIIKNFSSIISKIIEKKLQENEIKHTKATKYRKNITPEIRKELSEFAQECISDRVLLFEFSNGNSNLIGLPFLYITASVEVVKPTIIPIAQNYQRISTSIISEFLENLENKGYSFIEDLELIKNESPMIYHFLKPSNVKSALFYSLYGVNDTIGFIVAMSSDEKKLDKKYALPRMAESAQRISSLLNFDKLHKELEDDE